MPFRASGRKTKKGWPIQKKEGGRWKTIGHGRTRATAEASAAIRNAKSKDV